MRRWVLRSVFNVILFSSALVVTSLFILQHHSPPNFLSSTPLSVAVARGQFESIDAAAAAAAAAHAGHSNELGSDYYPPPPQVERDEDYAYSNNGAGLDGANHLQQQHQQKHLTAANTGKLSSSEKGFSTINCEINGEYSVECLLYKNSVYFPFEFLAKYFEVYGHFKIDSNNGSTTSVSTAKQAVAKASSSSGQQQQVSFQFEHSNSGHGGFGANDSVHECDGAFMNFATFNVERRNKVKYVSVEKGVPLSIQWDTSHRGYHFATQVAQFGLSYYSKLVNRERNQNNKQKQKHAQLRFQPGTPDSQNTNQDCVANFSSPSNSNFLTFSCKSFDYPLRVPFAVDDVSSSASTFVKFPIVNLTFEFSSPNAALSLEIQMDVTLPQSAVAAATSATPFSKPTSKQQRSIMRAMASTARTRRMLVLLTYRCVGGVDDVTSRLVSVAAGEDSMKNSHQQPLLMAEVAYSIAKCPTKASSIYRYFAIDVLKGLHVLPQEAPSYLRKLAHTDLTVASIDAVKFLGAGTFFDATLLQQADRQFALLAADWLVQAQSPDGGWPIPIGRQLLSGELHLEPGWHDAMAQGQAMSLLVRAYKLTSQPAYGVAALKALLPFKVPARQNGVVNRLFDKFDWFEEYPTTPGLYVLNGFIYSLIGLYDVATCLPPNDDNLYSGAHPSIGNIINNKDDLLALFPQARQLFSAGLQTLRSTLPLFDTGYATFYDLRHLSLPGSQPNVARWDYHATHVNQLYLLAKIDNETASSSSSGDIWTKTAKRWQAYMRGVRAPHN